MNEVVARRHFLGRMMSQGLAPLALSSLWNGETSAREPLSSSQTPGPHFAPRAKSVIWLFMMGGVSHMEGFDPKPQLTKYAGKTIAESPYADSILKSEFYRKNVRDFAGTPRALMPKLYPLQVGFRKRGQAGIEISDWWKHVGSCIDDMAVVRSMWTTDNDHAAQLQFHTGRHIFDGFFPTVGSWVHYGLGSLNENLPQFVVMGRPPGDCCGGIGAHGASYLGPEHAGVQMNVDPRNPLPFGTPGKEVFREERKAQFDLLKKLNQSLIDQGDRSAELVARMKSYELAYRMQMAIPDALRFSDETKRTRDLYGLDKSPTRSFGQQCLAARRLVERGVRFVQLYHGGGGGGSWDAHSGLKKNHSSMTGQVDLPIAGLLRDLKQRGLLDETLVVWATEFGRTPGAERSDGRDHHPYGFSVWLAGGGVQGGITHGSTDELGFHAAENRHYVTDIHATIMHQLGLDPSRMQVPGHKRLEIDLGKPIKAILA